MDYKNAIKNFSERLWAQKDLSVIKDYFYDDAIIYSPLNRFSGANTMKEIASKWLVAFPDLLIKSNDLIAENNRVVSQWMAKGTHLGGFFETSPTHREVIYNGVTIYTFYQDKIKEYWALVDIHSILSQLKVYRSISEVIDW